MLIALKTQVFTVLLITYIIVLLQLINDNFLGSCGNDFICYDAFGLFTSSSDSENRLSNSSVLLITLLVGVLSLLAGVLLSFFTMSYFNYCDKSNSDPSAEKLIGQEN